MQHAVRNLGKPGVVAQALSAVDIALWDLRARLLEEPLVIALGAVHDRTPVYGSGGSTSYDNDTLCKQLCGWVQAGIPRVKMKVGRDPDADLGRVRAARLAIGEDVELFVDANGAYHRKQALLWAGRFADYAVRWFEEPVSSDDLDGLRQLRDYGRPGWTSQPANTATTYRISTRCWPRAPWTACKPTSPALLGSPESSRWPRCATHAGWIYRCTAPEISGQVGTAVWHLRHLEYFHDHVRIEAGVRRHH